MLRRSLIFVPAFSTLALLIACGGSESPADDAAASMMAGGDGTTGSSTATNGASSSGSGSTDGTTTSDGTSGSTNGSSTGSDNGTTTGSASSGTTTGSDNGMSTGSDGDAGSGTSTGSDNGTTGTTGQGNDGNTGGSGNSSDTTGMGNDTTGSQGGAAAADGGNDGGGMMASAGSAAMGGSGPDLDENDKPNAAPGDMTSTAQDYLRLGDIRILNNNWGSEELGCNAPMSVFVNQDRTFGWNFNRGDCDTGGTNQNPDFPQIEFGIHPFGIGDELVTSPEFSSTALLPLQVGAIESASVNVENMSANLQSDNSWNITFEFWLSERDPVNDPNPGVYAEVMTFWGWQAGRWPEPPNGEGPTGTGAGDTVSSGGKSYTLWVQRDDWADGQWRYFQFRANDGPQRNFSGTVDVRALLNYLIDSHQYSENLWVTRLEVGSEIDDLTQGTVQLSNITFEVNGESRSPVFRE